MINMHVHTEFSHDSKESHSAYVDACMRYGLNGFSVTDHCDCEYSNEDSTLRNILTSFDETEKYKRKYCGKLRIISGIEMGEAIFDPSFAETVLRSKEWDVVLGSVHAVRYPGFTEPFSTIDFSVKSESFLYKYLAAYFHDVETMLDTTDFDILSHLTIPLRYIVKKYGRFIDSNIFGDQIDSVLKKAVQYGKTLEINTSGYKRDDGFMMPDEEIIDRYIGFGGKDFSIGSDSHTADNFSKGLREAAGMLLSKGITDLVYYEKRQKMKYKINLHEEEQL